MTYLLVPQEVSATEATLWIGAVNENPAQALLSLKANGNLVNLNQEWKNWTSQDGTYILNFQRLRLTSLQPRTSYAVDLRGNGEFKANAKLTTLPDQLPGLDDKPFTVLLGSCFCSQEDEAGTVGTTYSHLPSGEHPDMKILCGDQVYLDSPWSHYLWHTHTTAELETEFFGNYMRTWNQGGIAAGFRELLKDGANFFSSDDHEYWNNAPNKGIYVRDSWTDTERWPWLNTAKDLFRSFQSSSPTMAFSVGALSFLILDTRINRDADQNNFMTPIDLEAVGAWVQSLQGPGVIVVGQPLFSGKTGIKGNFTDWGLPDFKQYEDLVRYLVSSKHSIVILTGDVHYARVASCVLNAGTELIEVISSPLTLVDKEAAGKWEEAPEVFPPFSIPGIGKSFVQTESLSLTDNHFLTLEFAGVGAKVKMTIKAWLIAENGGLPASSMVYQRFLQ